ncbi:site-specific integrase [Nitrincola sp.]|uniref:site-specific integrase n=1 Tax=Nitrincola sp. TaxID=1926584 RepID=UPI003A8FCA1D
MATIKQLPSGNWNAQVRTKTLRASKTFKTQREAIAWSDRMVGSETNLSRFVSLYSHHKGIQPREPRAYLLETVRSHFESIPTLNDLEIFKRSRLAEVSSTTVFMELKLLQAVLRYADDYHDLAYKDPFKRFEWPSRRLPKDAVVTPEQLDQILGLMPPMAADAALLSYHTAMRRGELCSIDPKNIDWANRKLLLPKTKNGHPRWVPLNAEALAILDRRASFPIQPESLTKAFRKACRQLGIEGLTFHTLRHSAITKYAKKGLSNTQLQVVSGHRDLAMLNRYTHLQAEDVVDLL